MTNRLEDLLRTAADDGASMPFGPMAARTESEFDEIMDAWFLERRNSIEFEMLLGQSRKMIARLLREGAASPEGRKKALRLLRAIDRCLRISRAEEG